MRDKRVEIKEAVVKSKVRPFKGKDGMLGEYSIDG